MIALIFKITAQEVKIPWIWNLFLFATPSGYLPNASSTPVWSVFLPKPRSPIKKPSKNSSLFRFNFSDKFSKGLKPSSVKLGYFWKGMNINQDWYWTFFSSNSSQFFCFLSALFCCFFEYHWTIFIEKWIVPNSGKQCQNNWPSPRGSEKANFLGTKI